jgi:hypothetical protein
MAVMPVVTKDSFRKGRILRREGVATGTKEVWLGVVVEIFKKGSLVLAAGKVTEWAGVYVEVDVRK